MRKSALLLFVSLASVGCAAGGVPANAESAGSENLAISPWNWHSIPVVEPGGSLWLGFTAKNPTNQTVTADSFWGGCLLALTAPSGGVQTVGGPSVQGAAGSVRDMGPGESSTAVVDAGEIFDFTETGTHLLRWDTPLGTMEYPIEALAGLDYLLHRLANDSAYNEWGLYLYGEDGVFLSESLAIRVAAKGDVAVGGLAAFLDDEKECFIEGSEEATIGSMYAHRVEDYAAIMLAVILGADVPELRSMNPAVRDAGIARVRLLLGESGY
ncbi:MAG TPA: hypothetical protein VM054_07975 [bacterium]|nr:hypothetical protein [bacterium]